MKTTTPSLILSLFAVTALAVAGGKEGKVTGVISGAHCGVNGMACSATHDLRRAELPGVFTKENKFYVVVNVPQSFLAQWPVKDVTVEGTVYEEDGAVNAKKVSIKDGGKWRSVFENGSIIDDMGHKEKLASAVEIEGKWYCANCSAMHKDGMK
ncbi:MAG: hypothetical protein KF749_11715 [Bacteroidetes bacterium]|nr:hypothetical protein [Bacteroidota bacterium]MCW5894530.1 hypothetical protein [Bacteroidota bacterium]